MRITFETEQRIVFIHRLAARQLRLRRAGLDEPSDSSGALRPNPDLRHGVSGEGELIAQL
jgi:hypothetical protein